MGWSLPKPLIYGSATASIFGVICLLKDYTSGHMIEDETKLTDKVVIVTGANTGIGKETVFALAKRDAKVVMACRNMDKCETARRDIVLETQNKYVYCRECDLSSQESIRNFVNRFKKEHSKLHILINNGGVMRCPKSYTKEGIEMQLGVNHMGHFLLTNLLLDVLKDSAPSKIVNLSSTAHFRGKLKREDLNSDQNYNPAKAYSQSKLANVLFTRELANRLKGTGVTVNAVHPGLVNTEIMRHMTISTNFFAKLFVSPFLWLLAKSPKQGAQPVLFVALDPSVKDVTGSYFSGNKIVDPSADAKDDQLAQWLWKVSEKWTKLNTM